jgi:biopolymer transport protein ExbD
MALPALKEANRGDAAELLMMAIRSRELLLEGRRDEEAQRIRERAPGREQVAEILSMAAKLWREFGKAEKGAVVGQLAEQLAGRRRRQAKERAERSDQELRAAHVTVRAGETGEPQIFFREERVSTEQLHEVLHDLGDERLLLIHVRGEVSEELVHSIMETAKSTGIQRIKVEHIKHKKQAERDQGPGIHLFLKASEGGANIYHKERSISLEQVQEHLQDVDDPRQFVLVLHVGNDVPEKIVGGLMEMAKERGIERINVTAWKKK